MWPRTRLSNDSHACDSMQYKSVLYHMDCTLLYWVSENTITNHWTWTWFSHIFKASRPTHHRQSCNTLSYTTMWPFRAGEYWTTCTIHYFTLSHPTSLPHRTSKKNAITLVQFLIPIHHQQQQQQRANRCATTISFRSRINNSESIDNVDGWMDGPVKRPQRLWWKPPPPPPSSNLCVHIIYTLYRY